MAEGQIDINGLMVEQGWALAYRKYSKDYVGQEEATVHAFLRQGCNKIKKTDGEV